MDQPTLLALGEPSAIYLYFKVKLDNDSFTKDKSITNTIGRASATITPTNDYPIRIQKLDGSDPDKVISDTEALFTLKDADGNVVRDDITVIDGHLVVPAEPSTEEAADSEPYRALTVKQPGSYSLTETVAPTGYQLSSESLTVVVKEESAPEALVSTTTPQKRSLSRNRTQHRPRSQNPNRSQLPNRTQLPNRIQSRNQSRRMRVMSRGWRTPWKETSPSGPRMRPTTAANPRLP